MKMSVEAEKFLKKMYVMFMLMLLLPGLVGSTTIDFNAPTESSKVKASTEDVMLYQFNLTTNGDSTIVGTEPPAGQVLTDTNPWSGEDLKFYNASESWNVATDWIGYDNDDDNLYTSFEDALLDADGGDTLGSGSTTLTGSEVLVEYQTGNGAEPVMCVDNLTNPSAVRLDSDGDCTNGTTKEGLYILDGAAVEATAEIEAIAQASFTGNSEGLPEIYNITLRADSSGDLNATSFLLQDASGSVCVWFSIDGSGANLSHTYADCRDATRAIEISGILVDANATGVASMLQYQLDMDSKFNATVDNAVVTITTVDSENLTDPADINVGGVFAITVTQQGVNPVDADYFTLTDFEDGCHIFWFDKAGDEAGAPGIGSCEDVTKIDVSAATTNESVQEAITTAIDGHASFSAVEGSSTYITVVTQSFAGAAGNRANTENVANGDFALASFTGGDNTAAATEADTAYYYYKDGGLGDYEAGDDLFFLPDTTVAGTVPSSGVAITSTNPWSDLYFYDDGDNNLETESDWIGTSDDTTYLDVLQDLMIENTGNASDSDITNVFLYEGIECSGTSVELFYNGTGFFWENDSILWDLAEGVNTYTICADVVGSPTDDATIVIQIAQDDLGLASGTLPTGAGLPATGTITFDTTAPTATPVSIVSDNANSSLAKVGDNVSITFTVSEFVDNVVVTIDTNPADAIVNTGGFNWVAYRVMQTGDTQGAIAFTIDFEDEAGNPATTITSTTDASSVIFDETAPSGYSVTFDESYAYTGNEEAISFTFAGAEVGATYDYAISDGVNPDVSGSGTIATATDTISSINVSSLNDGTLTLSVTLTDPAGNQGGEVQDTITKDTVLPYVDSIVPVLLNESDAGVVTVDVTFTKDMTQSDIVTVNVMGLTGSPIAVTYDSWQSATVWRGSFTLTDNNETVTDAYYAVSGARDLAWNLMTALNSRSAENSLTVDTALPTVVSATAVPDPAGSEEITVTVVFSEEMDVSVNPVVQVVGLTTTPYLVTNVSYADNTWTGTFTPADDDEDSTGTITVAAATDLAGNVMENNTNAGSLEVDTIAPSGYGIEFVQDYVNLENRNNVSIVFSGAEVGATYEYSITSTGGAGEVNGSGEVTDALQQLDGINLFSLSDGNLTVELTLTDETENVGATVSNTGVTIKDIDPPIAGREEPTEPQGATPASITVEIDDVGSGMNESSIIVYLNDSVQTHLNNVTTDDDHVAFNATSGVLTITPGAGTPFELEDGTTTIIVYASDAAGNPMDAYQWSFIVDSEPGTINSVEVLPDNMVCALEERVNLNDELYIALNATDVGLSGVEQIFAFYYDGNISSDFSPNTSMKTIDRLDFGNGTTLDYIEMSYNESTEIWELSLQMQNTSETNYTSRAIGFYLIDEAGNEALSDVTTTAVFYDFTGPEMDESCDRNGDSTTNFCDILDWSDVDYTFNIEKNANPECNNDGALPWYDKEIYEEGEEGEEEYWMEIFEVTFYGLNFTSESTWEKLPQLASAIEPYITPPGQYGDSYISVNSTFFAELNVTADVSFYGLPFAEVPVIIGDALQEASISFTANEAFEINVDVCEVEAEEDADLLFECYDDCEGNETCEGECDTEFFGEAATSYQECLDEHTEEDCAYTTLYGICSVELGEDQYITYYVPNGELHFSVDGFSQYDITDDQEPIVTITSPEDSVYNEVSLVENITFEANGTGSQISSLQVLLNDEPLLEEPLDYFGIYMDDEYCVHDVEFPDSVLCNFELPELEDGEHTITIVATDFGGDEGNEAEESVTFVYDTTPPEITIIEPTNTIYYYGQTVSIQALLSDNLDEEPEAGECTLYTSDEVLISTYDLLDSLSFHVEAIVESEEGEYYNLTCYLTDDSNNEGSTEVHFVVRNETEEGHDLIPSEETTGYEFEEGTTTAILPYTNVIENISVPTTVTETPSLNLSQLIDSDGNARFESGQNLSIQRQTEDRNYTITIPNGTIVTPAEEWDSMFLLPEVKTSSDYSVSSGRISVVVEFGNDIQLDFSNPVQVVITGVGDGKRAGWTRAGDSSLTAISTVCDDKDAPTNVPVGGMCYINTDDNMYIWTYHFTEFGVYTPVSSSASRSSSMCITQWVCSEWGECIEGIQTRTCEKERSYCAIREEMPAITQVCGEQQQEVVTATPTPAPTVQETTEGTDASAEVDQPQENQAQPQVEATLEADTTPKTTTLNTAFLALTLLAVVIIIIAIAMFTRKKKE